MVIPYFRSKKHIEDDIKKTAAEKNRTWTIIRPVAFMENLTNDFFGRSFVTMWRQIGADKKLQLIGTKDIVRVAAEALINAEKEQYRIRPFRLPVMNFPPSKLRESLRRSPDSRFLSLLVFLVSC